MWSSGNLWPLPLESFHGIGTERVRRSKERQKEKQQQQEKQAPVEDFKPLMQRSCHLWLFLDLVAASSPSIFGIQVVRLLDRGEVFDFPYQLVRSSSDPGFEALRMERRSLM
ncbi:hypothetical protein O6H91_20G030600 [Diphasiastrum complanatum]|uniref:Uncharacterized protein n=1 Tax=Diphasiastrum complanatum TaxID=34168 RepID=A0ACC2ANW0_DIPCM|nr:hypothetical protein O6H91_20G030600 [Diphasiastrum complanatum]